jgi:hypothetical protein
MVRFLPDSTALHLRKQQPWEPETFGADGLLPTATLQHSP